MKRLLYFILTMTVVIPIQLIAQVPTTETKIPDSGNRTDSNGNKIGYWTEKVGEITFKGEYIENKKVKNWIGYHPNNMIAKIEYFNYGLKDGISIQFDKKGKITVVENFKNGLAHGQATYYSQYNESPSSETEYAFGKKNGVYRQYYENGKIQEESWFKDDLKNGLSTWNNKNGQPVAEYNYKAGNFDGLQKTFYAKDTLQSVENYKDNQLFGEFSEYFRDGKLKTSGKYINGQKDGTWTEYNELGKIEKVTRFKNGTELNKK